MKNIKYLALIFVVSYAYALYVPTKENNTLTYDLFKKIQLIRSIAKNVAKQSKQLGHIRSIELGEEGWPDPNPFYDQTKQGMYLSIDRYPKKLGTPWGQIMVYGSGTPSTNLTLAFMKNFKLAFKRNACQDFNHLPMGVYDSDKKNIKFYKVDAENNKTEIPRESLNQYKGTDTLITSNLCGCKSLYEILEVKGQPIPKLEQFNYYKDFRPYEHIKADWKSKIAQYKSDQADKPENP